MLCFFSTNAIKHCSFGQVSAATNMSDRDAYRGYVTKCRVVCGNRRNPSNKCQTVSITPGLKPWPETPKCQKAIHDCQKTSTNEQCAAGKNPWGWGQSGQQNSSGTNERKGSYGNLRKSGLESAEGPNPWRFGAHRLKKVFSNFQRAGMKWQRSAYFHETNSLFAPRQL